MAFAALANFANGQIAIDKPNVNGNSTILDFNDAVSNTNGIILPAVTNLSGALSSTPSENNGTFLFDKSDKKVKMRQNNTWVELSGAGNTTLLDAHKNSTPEKGNFVIVGSHTTNAAGILILESANKAMILPKITNPHLTVKSPYPGMICFDTTAKALAVFDGNKWNYWK